MELKLMGKNMRNGILTWSQGISPQNSCYLQSEKQSTHSEGSWQRHNWTEWSKLPSPGVGPAIDARRSFMPGAEDTGLLCHAFPKFILWIRSWGNTRGTQTGGYDPKQLASILEKRQKTTAKKDGRNILEYSRVKAAKETQLRNAVCDPESKPGLENSHRTTGAIQVSL